MIDALIGSGSEHAVDEVASTIERLRAARMDRVAEATRLAALAQHLAHHGDAAAEEDRRAAVAGARRAREAVEHIDALLRSLRARLAAGDPTDPSAVGPTSNVEEVTA